MVRRLTAHFSTEIVDHDDLVELQKIASSAYLYRVEQTITIEYTDPADDAAAEKAVWRALDNLGVDHDIVTLELKIL